LGRQFIAAIFAALVSVLPAAAAERITDFKSDMEIARDGSLRVTEVIACLVDGTAIKHGIFRVVPVSRNGRDRLALPLRVLRVGRDGHAEPYRVVSGANVQTIMIGDKDVMLDAGPHTWLIEYQLPHQVKATGGDHDRLFLDILGKGWPFPVDRVSATIRLPPDAKITQSSVDGGGHGLESPAKHPPQMATFRSIHALKAHEGMTVSIDIPKGTVQADKP
jgi:hypothetical protein